MKSRIYPVLAAVVLTASTAVAQQMAPAPPAPADVAPPSPQPQQAPPPPRTGVLPAGQWVYTTQDGWAWMPYAATYVRTTAGPYPSMYVYEPAIGWTWRAAPWVVGVGPRPYFGVVGPRHFVWNGHRWGYQEYGRRPVYRHPVYRGPVYR